MMRPRIDYPDMVAGLLRFDPAFERSAEYSAVVDEGMDDLPGVVLARFGRYLMRLAVGGDELACQRAFGALETLLQQGDHRVEEAVTNEVLEVRWEDSARLRRFFARLGPQGKSLYERTCKPL